MENFQEWFAFLAVVAGTSVVSGMVGMLGGMALLAALSVWFPPAIVIPLHGCIQALSNGSRVVFHLKAIDWIAVRWFAAGAVAGAALGRMGVPSLPPVVLNSLIGVGCLVGVWIPWLVARIASARFAQSKLPQAPPRPASLVALGAVGTFLAMIAGATGPIFDGFLLREHWSKQKLLGTKAAFQFTTHGLKIVVFSLSGFALGPWLLLLAAALPVTILGNRAGQALIHRVPTQAFLWILRVLVTALAVSMLGKP